METPPRPPDPPPAAGAPPAPPPPTWQGGRWYAHQGPAPGVAYGGFWVRLAAYIIDGLFLLIPEAVVGAAIGSAVFFGQGANEWGAARAWVTVVSLLIHAAYFVGFWAARGQTPGMMLLRLRVVRADTGQPVDASAALVRFLPFAVILLPLIGLLMALLIAVSTAIDQRKQGIHDRLANTLVVREL